MSLEQKIEALTAAVVALTAQIASATDAPLGASVAKTPARKPEKTTEPVQLELPLEPAPEQLPLPLEGQTTKADVILALKKLQDKHGGNAVKKFLRERFAVPAVGEIDPAKYQTVIDQASEAAA